MSDAVDKKHFNPFGESSLPEEAAWGQSSAMELHNQFRGRGLTETNCELVQYTIR